MNSDSAPGAQYSTAPNGEQFPLPTPQDEAAEILRLQALVADHRAQGQEIVIVLGVGFVGAVMAGIVADSVRKEIREIGGHDAASFPPEETGTCSGSPKGSERVPGSPAKFVIGVQRPSTRSYWKIPLLNRGVAPVEAEDPEVAPMIARCVLEKKTLTATYTYEALCLADVIVVDVQCDYFKETLGDCRKGHAEIAALEESLKIIGDKIQPHCLVLIETTVPPGTTEYVAYPILKKPSNVASQILSVLSAQHLVLIHSVLSTQHSALVLSPFSPTPTSASCPAGSTSLRSATSGGSAAGSTGRQRKRSSSSSPRS